MPTISEPSDSDRMSLPATPAASGDVDAAWSIVRRVASMGSCSQTHHEHIQRAAIDALREGSGE